MENVVVFDYYKKICSTKLNVREVSVRWVNER